MFNFCPSCGEKGIRFAGNKFHCADCGFIYYHNTAAASGCVIESDGRVLFLVRGKEPAAGKLALPGGFVDPGEGLLEGLYREIKEELGWVPTEAQGGLADTFKFFASFPNIYLYKNIVYNTCDVFFSISVPGLSEKHFTPEAGEIAGLRFLLPGEINMDDLAFDSTRKAIKVFLEKR